jgi:two-component system, LytTR family, response regulator LytT
MIRLDKQPNNPDFLVQSLTTLKAMSQSNDSELDAYILELAEELRPNLAKKPYQISFLVQNKQKQCPLLVADIAFVCFENDTVYLYNFKGDKYPIFKTLEEIEQAVSPHDFYRINRQMLINRRAIKEIEPYIHQKQNVHLTIPFAEKVIVSKLRVAAFLHWIEKG